MGDAIQLTGRLVEVGETEKFESGFMKRCVVLKTPGEYPQELLIEFWKDKCSILDRYLPGEAVEVSVNLMGNEYNGRRYVKLQGWLIHHDKSEAGQALPEAAPAPESYVSEPLTEDQDNLPF